MPYIDPARREELHHIPYPNTPGELNYCLTQLLLRYLMRAPQPTGYTQLNDCLGALSGAQLEFYRRVVVPFEEEKRDIHGDVYP